MATGGNEILIIGGYGHVGSQIAARLLKTTDRPVRIAGRSPDRLHQAAARLGCESAVLDIAAPDTWPQALDRAAYVIVCVDQVTTAFARAVLERGLMYADITADDDFLRRMEQLDGLARASGGSAVLSVGLAPGLTNLLASKGTAGLDRVDSVRIGILLGLGDSHGAAAIDWTLRNFRKVRRRKTDPIPFGTPPRAHPVIPFDFADQHVLRRTLGIAQVHTFITFDTPLLSRLSFPLLSGIATSPMLSRVLKAIMLRTSFGSDRTALSIRVEGIKDGRRLARTLTMEGRQEARITALVTALLVEHALARGIPAGVHHIDQVLSIDDLAPDLSVDAGLVFDW